jgi:hypothetical protein
LLELAGQSFGYDGVSSPDRRARAVRLADKAFRLNELGSLPRVASYTAAVCEGDEECFRRISGLALRDYPNNPAVMFDVAQWPSSETVDTSDKLPLEQEDVLWVQHAGAIRMILSGRLWGFWRAAAGR